MTGDRCWEWVGSGVEWEGDGVPVRGVEVRLGELGVLSDSFGRFESVSKAIRDVSLRLFVVSPLWPAVCVGTCTAS